jgi:urease accessory protein
VTDDAILKNYLLSIKSGNAAGIFPVALAVAGNALAISKQNAGLALLYSFTVSIVGSALRLGILQHFEGQKIIHRLKPDMIKIVQDNIDRPLSSIWQFAPGIDIVQISHEKMNSKMFIT